MVQGQRDPQVSKAETEQLLAGLRERKIPVEYLLADNEGHGFTHAVNQMAMLAAAEKFLAQHLGGRHQAEATPEVTTRLSELTVDLEKMTAPKAADGADSPILASDLKPGYYRYQTTLALGEKHVVLNTATIIEEKDGSWEATEIAETPNGTSTDTAILEKGTLAVLKRSMNQGPVNVLLDFADGRATGKVINNNQEKSISAPLAGKLFADAAGSLQSIACLPLAEGFTLVYRNFDVLRQREKPMRLKVAGSEKIAVPAGTFDAFVVQVASPESTSDRALVWIAKDSRQVVKMMSISSAMGGATVTSELVGKEGAAQ